MIFSQIKVERLEEVLNFMGTNVYPKECICRALNVSKNIAAVAELNRLCSACIQDGVSMVAVENKSDRIVGIAISKLQEKSTKPGTHFFEEFSKTDCNEKESITLINTLIGCNSAIDTFQALDVEKLIELVFLSVLPEYHNQEVDIGLVRRTVQLLENTSNNETGPEAVVALFTSEHTQNIGKSLEFEVLSTISFATISCEGVKLSDKLGSSCKTAKVYAKKIYQESNNRQFTSVLTKDRFPYIKRRNFAILEDKDVNYFKKILENNRVITDAEDVKPYNVDLLEIFNGDAVISGSSKIVLKPKTTEEVSAILKYCNERKLAVCPQGGNTGLVGGCIPVFDEIIISTILMNQILNFNSLTGVLVCQSGCVLEILSNFLKEKGFIMPLDLGAKSKCNIGGNVSTNAAGLRVVRYGSLHNTVLGIQAVLSNGDIVDGMNTFKKDNTGYHLKHLFIGSEGTLGIVTAVAIQCPPLPQSVNLALLGFSTFEKVLEGYNLARKGLVEILSGCEFLDCASVKIVDSHFDIKCPIENMPFYMMIETSGSNASHDEDKLNAFLDGCLNSGIAIDAIATSEPSKMKAIWKIREGVGLATKTYGFAYAFDVSVPLNVLYDGVAVLTQYFKNDERIKCICGFGHIGDGSVHVSVSTVKFEDDVLRNCELLIHKWTASNRGSVSAEHGIGFEKTKFVSYTKTAKEIALMRQVKKLFDPNGILNPYKVLEENYDVFPKFK